MRPVIFLQLCFDLDQLNEKYKNEIVGRVMLFDEL